MDITNFMSWFLNHTLVFFNLVYSFLDNITFYNISLHDYCIAIILIPVGVSILIAIAKNPPIEKNTHRKEKRKNEES